MQSKRNKIQEIINSTKECILRPRIRKVHKKFRNESNLNTPPESKDLILQCEKSTIKKVYPPTYEKFANPDISSLNFPPLHMTTRRLKQTKNKEECITSKMTKKKERRTKWKDYNINQNMNFARSSLKFNRFIRKTRRLSPFIRSNIMDLIRNEDVVEDIKKIKGEDELKCEEEIFMGLSPKIIKNVLNEEKKQKIATPAITPDLQLMCNEVIIREEENNELEEVKEDLEVEVEFEEEIINFLHCKEREQSREIDLRYLTKNHPSLNWGKRAVIIDWLMSFSANYNLKRNTLFMGINFMDRMLTIERNIDEERIQLIGIVSLYIACKAEEIQPKKVEYFSRHSDFSIEEINQMEIHICKALNFHLNPVVISYWADYFAFKWDDFIKKPSYNDLSQEIIKKTHIKTSPKPELKFEHPTFKKKNESSFELHCELFQILDTSLLDSYTLRFDQRGIVLSTMYLLLGKKYGLWNETDIIQGFQKSSEMLTSQTYSEFNSLFGEFLSNFAEVELSGLLPYIQFVAGFFLGRFEYERPEGLFQSYEDMLSVQKYNGDNLNTVRVMNLMD